MGRKNRGRHRTLKDPGVTSPDCIATASAPHRDKNARLLEQCNQAEAQPGVGGYSVAARLGSLTSPIYGNVIRKDGPTRSCEQVEPCSVTRWAGAPTGLNRSCYGVW